jgi:hypothetical protein
MTEFGLSKYEQVKWQSVWYIYQKEIGAPSEQFVS